MEISFHGQSCVQIEHDSHRIIIDPFITGNELSDLKAENVKVDFILLTHGHGDHVGDTVEIAKNNNATVIAPVELAEYLATQGLDTIPMNIGGTGRYDWGSVKFVHAFHSSSYDKEDGAIYAGMPTGLIVKIGDQTIYHTGDTGLFGDLKLNADRNGPIDVLFIPIGDHFTMGIDDAAYATNELIQPRIVVPIHYNTFPPIKQDPEKFAAQVNTTIDCQILNPGETVNI